MRYLRLCVGFFLLFGALYIIVVEQMTGASSNAFINAPLLTARAPVAGDVDLPDRVPGAFIKVGATLFSIEDARADLERLDDLQLERDLLAAELKRHLAERTARQKALGWIETTAGTYYAARLKELAVTGGMTPADPGPSPVPNQPPLTSPGDAADEAKLGLGESETDRGPDLAGDFANEAIEGSSDAEALQQRASRLAISVDGGTGEAWNMALRQREEETTIALVDADISRIQEQLLAYESRIERELSRLVNLRGDTLTSQVNGVLWQELTANGVNVQRGDPVMNIADCDSTLVTLSVSESIYNSLSTGDAATFRPLGSDDVMQGTVARLAGAGAASVYNGMAVAPSEEHLQRYDVALVVPELRADAALGCSIGRTGRVFFEDRPFDILWKLWE